MKTMPLSLTTWRVGKSSIDSIESLLIKESECDTTLGKLKQEFGSVFYLSTCQRIILVSSLYDKRRALMLRDKFIELSKRTQAKVDLGETYVGGEALRHLAELISSLDSIVIGEDQIQYQFKQAYNQTEDYLDQNLKHMLQQIIRIGKRMRSRTILGEGKTSMMSLISQVYEKQISDAQSIGILGTGRMAQGVINVASGLNCALSVYSRKSERIDIVVNGYKTKDFKNLARHDIFFTATTVDMPLITTDLISNLGDNPITIFDLGMPRNCSLAIKALPNVKLIGIEDLLQLSHQINQHNDFANVYQVLHEEINSVLDSMNNKLKAPYYKSLRTDLSRIAEKYKSDFINTDNHSEMKYQQLINRLIHVSQKHLQNALLESEVKN